MNTEKELKILEKFNKKLFATSNTFGSLGLKSVVVGSGSILIGLAISLLAKHNNKKLLATSNTFGSLGLKVIVVGSGSILIGWAICPWVGHNDKKIGKLKRDIKHGH